jgi:hypothetical protein
MIELNKPRFNGLTCNVCYSNNDILEITFRGNDSGSGTTVALCSDCRNELEGLIELHKLRGKGENNEHE